MDIAESDIKTFALFIELGCFAGRVGHSSALSLEHSKLLGDFLDVRSDHVHVTFSIDLHLVASIDVCAKHRHPELLVMQVCHLL